MSKDKLYFRSIDDTTCHSLDWHLDDARYEELEKNNLLFYLFITFIIRYFIV